jgi:hypothetical protein
MSDYENIAERPTYSDAPRKQQAFPARQQYGHIRDTVEENLHAIAVHRPQCAAPLRPVVLGNTPASHDPAQPGDVVPHFKPARCGTANWSRYFATSPKQVRYRINREHVDLVAF